MSDTSGRAAHSPPLPVARTRRPWSLCPSMGHGGDLVDARDAAEEELADRCTAEGGRVRITFTVERGERAGAVLDRPVPVARGDARVIRRFDVQDDSRREGVRAVRARVGAVDDERVPAEV